MAANSSIKQDFISRLSTNKQHLVALALLFLLPLLLYSAIFFGGQQYLGHDVVQWRAGAESIMEYEEEFGENPLWASNMFSGMPGYVISVPKAAPNVDTFFKWIGGNAHPLAFFWVLLAGAYFFFVIQGVRPFSSALGSILIGFTTYLPIIIEAGHYNKFVAFAFIPWMFVGYWLVSRSDKKWLGFFVFALAMMLELRANHPQVTYYFLYLLGFWWIYDTYFAYIKDNLRDWMQRTGISFAAGILAILCSIELYWRMYEYAEYSIRGGSSLDTSQGTGLSLDYAFSWSQGVGELLTLAIPGLYGGSSGEAYWGPKSFTSGPHYFGAIAVVLALIGIFKYRDKIKYLFLGVGSLTTLFSLGSNLPWLNEFMFHYVPYLNKFRTPEMWLITTVFCFSVLAVYGIETLFDITQHKKQSLKELYVPLGVAIGFGVLFAAGSSALLSYEKPGQAEQLAQQVAQQNNVQPDNPQVQDRVSEYINSELKPDRKAMASSDSIRYLILVLLASGLITAFLKRKVSAGYFLIALLILAAYDMLSVGERYVNEDRMMPDRITTEQLIRQQQRASDEFVAENIESGEGYPYRAFPLDNDPFNNAIPAYFYPSIGGYTGVKLGYYQEMVDNLLMEQNGFHHALLDMLNVKFITFGQQLPFDGYSEVFSKGNERVYENENVLPKAFFVESTETVGSAREAVDFMNSNSFDPAQTAVIETDESIETSSPENANVSVETYRANFIELDVSADEDAYLVLSEVFYPAGWEATINGEPIDIHKTNFVLRGLQIPAGDHSIEMRFEPASHIWGLRLARFGHLILWLSGIAAFYPMIVSYRRKRTDQDEDV